MITQLLLSSSGKPIITASYVIVGGGGGAVIDGADGLGGTVINGDTTIPDGSYSITVGAGGSRGGGLGSSSVFMGLIASGSTRTTTATVNGETFSGVDQGSPDSAVKGSGALASYIVQGQGSCPGSNQTLEWRCNIVGGVWIPGTYSNGNGNNGVVILTIPTIYSLRIAASNASITTSGSNTIYGFNYSGSLEAS